METKSVEEATNNWANRWKECPNCKKKTQAKYKCQRCNFIFKSNK